MRLERGAAIAVLIFALAWLVWTLTEDQRAAATHRAELAAIMTPGCSGLALRGERGLSVAN